MENKGVLSTYQECQNIRVTLEITGKRSTVKGSIEDFIGKATEVQNMGKVVQLSVVFYILSRGCPMMDYPSITALLHFLKN